METVVLIIYLVVYFGSFSVLEKKYPKAIEHVTPIDVVWFSSKSKSLYLGWLLVGEFKTVTKGSWLRWFFEISRFYVAFSLCYLIWYLYGLLPAMA